MSDLLDKYLPGNVPVDEVIKHAKYGDRIADQIKETKFFEATDIKLKISVNMLNREILKILKEEGVTSSRALSERLDRNEWTILVELRYLESLGLVREVK